MLTRGKTSRMDAGAIMDYFKPLMDWLKQQNSEEAAGWSKFQKHLSCSIIWIKNTFVI